MRVKTAHRACPHIAHECTISDIVCGPLAPPPVESTEEKDSLFSIVAICIMYFAHSTSTNTHTTRVQREVMEAEDNIEAVRPTHNGTTEMSQGNQACDGSLTVARGTQRTIL